MQSDGQLKADGFLRLQGHPNIFVAGDVTNLPEGRMAITVTFHVPSIVGNPKTLAASPLPGEAKLKSYSPKRRGKGMGKIMIMTLGRRDGLTSLPFGQFRMPFLARKVKSETILVPRYRQQVGLK